MRVAFQGEPGAYSENAAYKFFGKETEVVPCETFAELFNRVSNGLADFGVAPVENSAAGTVMQVYDLLLEHDLHIIGEVKLQNGTKRHDNNVTRFFIVSKEVSEYNSPETNNKISLVFSTRHEPGSLYECMGEFARRGINLTKLESRPRPNRPWEYVFYLDFEGNLNYDVYVQAVTGLLKRAAFVKILGSYRAAD